MKVTVEEIISLAKELIYLVENDISKRESKKKAEALKTAIDIWLLEGK